MRREAESDTRSQSGQNHHGRGVDLEPELKLAGGGSQRIHKHAPPKPRDRRKHVAIAG